MYTTKAPPPPIRKGLIIKFAQCTTCMSILIQMKYNQISTKMQLDVGSETYLSTAQALCLLNLLATFFMLTRNKILRV